MQYFYEEASGEQAGPVNIDTLIDKKINKDTMVWREGMSDWESAGDLEELAFLFDAKQLEEFKNKRYSEKKTDSISKQKKAKRKIIRNVLLLLLIIGGFIALFAVLSKAPNGSGNYEDRTEPKREYREKKMDVENTEITRPESFLSIDGDARKNLLGGKVVINGTIYNQAAIMSYKNIRVRVTFYNKNGVAIDNADEFVYKTIKPGRSKIFNIRTRMPKATERVNWKVIGAEPIK